MVFGVGVALGAKNPAAKSNVSLTLKWVEWAVFIDRHSELVYTK